MRGKGGVKYSSNDVKHSVFLFLFLFFLFFSFPSIGWAIRPIEIKLVLLSLVILILITLPGIALTTLGK